MSKTIATENAPAAIGPYVQGVDLGSMIITSGQIPVDPKTGSVPEDVSAQARQSLNNVKAIVEAAGLTVGDIVKTTVFVKDLRNGHALFFYDHLVHLHAVHLKFIFQFSGDRTLSGSHESNQEDVVVKQTLCLDTAAVFHDIFENIKNLFLELIIAKFLCQCIRLLLLLLRL